MHLVERGASERDHGEERVDFTVKEGRLHGRESGQTKRTSLGEVEGNVSGRKRSAVLVTLQVRGQT